MSPSSKSKAGNTNQKELAWSQKMEDLSVHLMIGDSTVHGLKSACDSKHGLCRRIVWLSLLLFMCCFFLTSVGLTLRDYFM